MKVYISYFYKVRFFKPWMIPVSTAIWDPKWFHDFLGQDMIVLDKNGVYNGIREPRLAPGSKCSGLCRGKENCKSSPEECKFLRSYKQQLSELDFHELMEFFNELCNYVSTSSNLEEEPAIVLLVYEAPDNPCSERKPLMDWFKENGCELKELEI